MMWFLLQKTDDMKPYFPPKGFVFMGIHASCMEASCLFSCYHFDRVI